MAVGSTPRRRKGAAGQRRGWAAGKGRHTWASAKKKKADAPKPQKWKVRERRGTSR